MRLELERENRLVGFWDLSLDVLRQNGGTNQPMSNRAELTSQCQDSWERVDNLCDLQYSQQTLFPISTANSSQQICALTCLFSAEATFPDLNFWKTDLELQEAVVYRYFTAIWGIIVAIGQSMCLQVSFGFGWTLSGLVVVYLWSTHGLSIDSPVGLLPANNPLHRVACLQI
jgi:hypothetical protein